MRLPCHVTLLGVPALGSVNLTTVHTQPCPPRLDPPRSVTGHTLPPPLAALSPVGSQTDTLATITCEPRKKKASFFYPAQAHVGRFVPIVSVPMTTCSPLAKARSCGTDLPAQSEGANRES